MEKVVLELNINQINAVLEGLAELPLKKGLDTFSFIREAADRQLNPPKDLHQNQDFKEE